MYFNSDQNFLKITLYYGDFQDGRIEEVAFLAAPPCETKKADRQLLSKVGEQQQQKWWGTLPEFKNGHSKQMGPWEVGCNKIRKNSPGAQPLLYQVGSTRQSGPSSSEVEG